MLFSVNTSTKSYLTLTETRNLTGTRLRLQPVPGVQIAGERVKLYPGKTGEGTRRGGARGNSVKLQFMLQLRSRWSIKGGKSSCTGAPFPFPPLVSHCVFFFVNFSPAFYYLNAWNRLLWLQRIPSQFYCCPSCLKQLFSSFSTFS